MYMISIVVSYTLIPVVVNQREWERLFYQLSIYIISFIPGFSFSLAKLTSPGSVVVSFHVLLVTLYS